MQKQTGAFALKRMCRFIIGIKTIRTYLLPRISSDYLNLVPVTGLEPVRCRQRWILSFGDNPEPATL